MLLTPADWVFLRKLTCFIFLFCIAIALHNQNAEYRNDNLHNMPLPSIVIYPALHNMPLPSSNKSAKSTSPSETMLSEFENFFSTEYEGESFASSLQYDYYRESCPNAEQVIWTAMMDFYRANPSVTPAILRLLFHDCFIEGCDASILLDPTDGAGSEKDSPPNDSLKGFDIIDTIKSRIEQVCPGVVSCADILVLAARDGVVMAGGPFYPLNTGRRDSLVGFQDVATQDLPSPQGHLSDILASFSSRGFDERETVCLLGSHGIGMIHCRFFQHRLYNFSGTNEPDPSINPELLKELRLKCGTNSTSSASSSSLSESASPSSSTRFFRLHRSSPAPMDTYDREMVFSYQEAIGAGSFGTQYYHGLLRNQGLLYTDQQLMAREDTEVWVRAYAADTALFRHDFALAMMKMSDLGVLTAPLGQIRRECSKVAYR